MSLVVKVSAVISKRPKSFVCSWESHFGEADELLGPDIVACFDHEVQPPSLFLKM